MPIGVLAELRGHLLFEIGKVVTAVIFKNPCWKKVDDSRILIIIPVGKLVDFDYWSSRLIMNSKGLKLILIYNIAKNVSNS